jgi:hypothetical protein
LTKKAQIEAPIERLVRRSSGLRSDRETMPASGEQVPGARPTDIPDFDIAAFAESAAPPIPPDVTVPQRTRRKVPDDLSLRLAFLLLHVDGRTSLDDIARTAQLPVNEVLAGFLELIALGLVAIGGPRESNDAFPTQR